MYVLHVCCVAMQWLQFPQFDFPDPLLSVVAGLALLSVVAGLALVVVAAVQVVTLVQEWVKAAPSPAWPRPLLLLGAPLGVMGALTSLTTAGVFVGGYLNGFNGRYVKAIVQWSRGVGARLTAHEAKQSARDAA
jgi:hypothetical protein